MSSNRTHRLCFPAAQKPGDPPKTGSHFNSKTTVTSQLCNAGESLVAFNASLFAAVKDLGLAGVWKNRRMPNRS